MRRDESRYPFEGPNAVEVALRHGIVTLNGVVGSWAEKHAIEEATLRIAGVRDVANDVDIKLSWSIKRSDADIAEAVRHTLEWDVFVPHDRIRTTVSDDGHVKLHGTVSTLQQSDEAERAVRNLAGVRTVTNEIAIEAPKVAESSLRGSIEATLLRHIEREAHGITVEVRGDTVVLAGTVESWHDRRVVVGAARGTPGIKHVDDRLRIGA